MMMSPFYTYDAEADALYVLLADEFEGAINRTEELGPTLHVDLDANEEIVGVEFLYPRTGMDLDPVKERYGMDLVIPFTFAGGPSDSCGAKMWLAQVIGHDLRGRRTTCDQRICLR